MSLIYVRMIERKRCFDEIEREVIDVAEGHKLKQILNSAAEEGPDKEYVYGTSE